MKIDKRLNLVTPIETDLGKIYVHSTPIGREVYEHYFLVVARTFAEIFKNGLGIGIGPSVAGLMLKKVAEEMDAWADVDNGLLSEIRRLTNVIVPTGRGGWNLLPFEEMRRETSQYFSEDEIREVESVIVFFTVASAMLNRREAPLMLQTAADLWRGQITSLDATAFKNSLPTSTATETSQEPAPAVPLLPRRSSIPH